MSDNFNRNRYHSGGDNRTCNSCGERGHIGRNCPSASSSQGNRRPQGGSGNQLGGYQGGNRQGSGFQRDNRQGAGHQAGSAVNQDEPAQPPVHRDGKAPQPSQDTRRLEDSLVAKSDGERMRDDFAAAEQLSELQLTRLPKKDQLQGDPLNNPTRPGYATRGQPVILWTNHFDVEAVEEINLYRYSIDVRRNKSPKQAAKEKKAEHTATAGGNRPRAPAERPAGKKLKRIIQLYIADKTDDHASLGHLKDQIATDFSNILISCERLSEKVMAGIPEGIIYKGEFQDDAGEDPLKYFVTLTEIPPNPLPMRDLMNYLRTANNRHGSAAYAAYKQALEIIFGFQAKNEHDHITASIGRKHHLVDARIENRWLGGNLDAVRGYIASVKFAAGKFLLNVQVQHTASYSRNFDGRPPTLKGRTMPQWQGTLAHGMCLMHVERGYDEATKTTRPEVYEAIEDFYKGVQVEVTHLPDLMSDGVRVPRLRRIIGFVRWELDTRNGVTVSADFIDPSGVKFTPKAKGTEKQGPETTVAAFFKDRYNIDCNPYLPVVKVGSPNAPNFLPAEVCKIMPGQPRLNKLDSYQTSQMLTFAAKPPGDKAEFILRRSPAVLKLVSSNTTLVNFGLKPTTSDLLSVDGRILSAPRLLYGRNYQVNPKNGSWNLIETQFIKSGTWKTPPTPEKPEKWGFLIVDDNPGVNPVTAMETFHGVLTSTGVNCGPYRKTAYEASSNAGSLNAQFKKAKDHGLELLMVFIGSKGPHPYKVVKQQGDVGPHAMHTICVTSNFRKSDTYANVALKFNLKLGGQNNHIPGQLGIIENDETMLIGLDVTHPDPGSSAPSIAGLVSSIDRHCQQFKASIYVQRQERTEMLDSDPLSEMFVTALGRWRGKPLRNVIVYRDGVSEGQYNSVLRVELAALKKGAQKYKAANPKVFDLKISIIICGKRHHTRFYPSKQKDASEKGNNNCRPGTMVDRYVTGGRDWDFYLQAHQSMKGTAKPCHYVVIHDEIFNGLVKKNDRADDLIQMTHYLSYCYARATKAVSYCPPAYYADRVCDRARMYVSDMPAPQPNTPLDQIQRNYQSRCNLGELLRDSMFYV